MREKILKLRKQLMSELDKLEPGMVVSLSNYSTDCLVNYSSAIPSTWLLLACKSTNFISLRRKTDEKSWKRTRISSPRHRNRNR